MAFGSEKYVCAIECQYSIKYVVLIEVQTSKDSESASVLEQTKCSAIFVVTCDFAVCLEEFLWVSANPWVSIRRLFIGSK